MSITVLDASAAAEIVLNRPASDELSNALKQSEWVIAPQLYIAEVTNIFWKYQEFGGLSKAHCGTFLEQGIALPDDYIEHTELYREAFSLSCQLKHSAYDCLYLVVARRNDAKLLSMDNKLIKLAQQTAISTL